MASYHEESPTSVFDLLPDEQIIQILLYIPSKPLCRFKSVSKRFNSIISHSHFLPFYVSRASSWVILDRNPQLVPDSTHPIQFQLADRPKISTCEINPKKLASDPITDPVPSKYPSSLLQSSNGLILFTQLISRDPDKEHERDPTNFSWEFEQLALYVVNPITGEWFGLPQPIGSICGRNNVGFTSRVDPETGVVARFMVVEYLPRIGTEYGCLKCFVSDTGNWVLKAANCRLGKDFKRADGAFEFKGKIFWVDLTVGLITWDVTDNDYFKCVESSDKAVCRLIPIPNDSMKPHNTRGLEDERCFGIGGGFVQFMEVFKEGDCTVRLWRLKDYETGADWSLMYKVSWENVESFLRCETGERGSGGGGSEMPKPCFIHPFESDVAYFRTDDCIFSFNLRTQKVGPVDVFTPQLNVLPFVLPKWSSPIPKPLCVVTGESQVPKIGVKKIIQPRKRKSENDAKSRKAPRIRVPRDTLLVSLTKKVINSCKQAKGGILDVSKIVEILEVKKRRRMYDVFMVMESTNLIERSCNGIRWKGASHVDVASLRADIENLTNEECRLDEQIRDMEERLKKARDDDNNQKWLFVTNEDIKAKQNETLIVVTGKILDILPDPDKGVDSSQSKHRASFRSKMGPIAVKCLRTTKVAEKKGESQIIKISQDETFIEVKVPHGMILDILPDHKGVDSSQSRHTTSFRSKIVPIVVKYARQFEDKVEEINVGEAPSNEPSMSAHEEYVEWLLSDDVGIECIL